MTAPHRTPPARTPSRSHLAPALEGVPSDLARPVERLRRIGVQLAMVAEGTVLGSVIVEAQRFDPLEPVIIHPLQRFEVLPGEKIRVIGSSPLAQLGPVSFVSVHEHDHLARLLEMAWREHVKLTRAAIVRARQLARDAALHLDPWRVEGSVDYNREKVQLLFSSKGDRACICGLNGRPLSAMPAKARVILSVEPTEDYRETDRKWRQAIEQARANLIPTKDVVVESHHLSLDIASRDLETSYQPEDAPLQAPVPVPPLVRSMRPPPIVEKPLAKPSPRPLMPVVQRALPKRTVEVSTSLDLTSDDLP